jgi:hypothetical protein
VILNPKKFSSLENHLKNILTFLSLFFVSSIISVAQGSYVDQYASDAPFIKNTLYPAVTLLYTQDDMGTMDMRCTATAFEAVSNGYLFSTAAHCAVENSAESDEFGKIKNASFFITLDEAASTKTFLKANVIACGKQIKGNDFCIIYVKTANLFPVVPIGKDAAKLVGESVVNVSSPLGLGKQTFYGRITLPILDRSVVVDQMNWTHTVLMQLPGTNSGSSGSAIVCLEQHAICGFLVGTIAGSTVVAVPVSRFSNFLTTVKACKKDEFLENTNAEDVAFSFKCKDDKKK